MTILPRKDVLTPGRHAAHHETARLAELGRDRRLLGAHLRHHAVRPARTGQAGLPRVRRVYDAYIEHYIAECLRNPQPIDKGASEPASQAEHEAACRVSVLQADRLDPENRPL